MVYLRQKSRVNFRSTEVDASKLKRKYLNRPWSTLAVKVLNEPQECGLPRPVTMDLALARPTLSVVLGSRLGGSGAGERPLSNTIKAVNCQNSFQFLILHKYYNDSMYIYNPLL